MITKPKMTFCTQCAENVWHPLDTHRCKVHREDVNPVTGYRQMKRCEAVRVEMGDVCPKFKEKPPRVRFVWTGPRLLLAVAAASMVGWLIAWLLT